MISVKPPRKPLPQAIDAEKGLLGSMLLDPKKVCENMAIAKVDERWFHHPCHKKIYAEAMAMLKADKPIDFISLIQFLEDRNTLAEVGGAAAISELFTFVPTAANSRYYLEILHEKLIQRIVILECDKIREEVHPDSSLQQIWDLTTRAFSDVRELCEEGGDFDSHKEPWLAFLDKMDSIAQGTHKVELFTTSFPKLDEETGGMERGEVYVIQGQTSTGKSLFSQAMLQENISLGGKSGAVWTIEMPDEQYRKRIIARDGPVSLRAMREGRYSKGEMQNFMSAAKKWADLPLYIRDLKNCKMTAGAICADIRRLKRTKGIDMVLIDHLNLVRFKSQEGTRRDQELESFTSELKRMAGELDLVVILVAQANEKGVVFDSTQVESAADGVINLVPDYEMVGGVRKVVGTKAAFVQKWRVGPRGWSFPLKMEGSIATIRENRT